MTKRNDQIVLYIQNITTPLGMMQAGGSADAIYFLKFAEKQAPNKHTESLEKKFNCEIVNHSNEITEQTAREMDQYFKSRLKKFTVPLHLCGSKFQNMVWKELTGISYGKTISYSEQAKKIGKPKAVRAVASANAANNLAIIVPCHRVIGSDGSLTGYSGGLKRKKYLLNLERSNSDYIIDSDGQRSIW